MDLNFAVSQKQPQKPKQKEKTLLEKLEQKENRFQKQVPTDEVKMLFVTSPQVQKMEKMRAALTACRDNIEQNREKLEELKRRVEIMSQKMNKSLDLMKQVYTI